MPGTRHTTHAAFGFDAPRARAPQSILLAVPPDESAPLTAEALPGVVLATRQLARARMAQPDGLGAWALAVPTSMVLATGPAGSTLVEDRRDLGALPPARADAAVHRRAGAGFAAEIADPLWMLGRQWQVGEHAGEDASTPVLVELDVAHTPLEPVAGLDPTVVPAEPLIEGAADDWWTIGRRVASVGSCAPT